MRHSGHPCGPTHPGAVLKEELEYRSIPLGRFSGKTGISCPELEGILNGERPVTASLAAACEAVLGIEAAMLLRMQARYDRQAGGGEADPDDETLAAVREIKNGGGTRCGTFGDYLKTVQDL